jgi:hypothetical protein
VDIDIEPILDGPEQINIIKDIKARVETALDKYLRAAERYRLFDLPEDRFAVKEIGISIICIPPKCAERASVAADICIVDVAVNNKGADLLGMKCFSDDIRPHAEAQKVGIPEQGKCLLPADPVFFRPLYHR